MRGTWGAMILILAALLTGCGQSAEDYYESGVRKMNAGNRSGALEDFAAAVELDPDFADPYVARGNIRLEAGDLDAALTDFDRALKLDPESAEAYVGRASVNMQIGQLELAEEDARRALKLDPENPTASFILRQIRTQRPGELR